MKHIVITGVSTGIGKATAELLINHGYHVFGSVRKESDASELQEKFGANFTPLLFDVTDVTAVKSAAEYVKNCIGSEQGLTALINNAGIGIGGPMMYQSLEEIRHHFEVNVFGVISVSQAFLPLLGAQHPQHFNPGKIINMSSVSGKLVFPFLGAYAASKHALEAVSDAMRRELMIFGIDLIVLEPGSVNTEIWDKVERQNFNIYKNSEYASILSNFQKRVLESGRAGVSPSVIARTILRVLESKSPKSRYAVTGSKLTSWLIPRILPDRLIDRIIAKQIGLNKK